MFHPIRLQTGEYKTEILIDSALMEKYPESFIETKLNKLFAEHIEYVEHKRMEKHRAPTLINAHTYKVVPGHRNDCGLIMGLNCDCGNRNS